MTHTDICTYLPYVHSLHFWPWGSDSVKWLSGHLQTHMSRNMCAGMHAVPEPRNPLLPAECCIFRVSSLHTHRHTHSHTHTHTHTHEHMQITAGSSEDYLLLHLTTSAWVATFSLWLTLSRAAVTRNPVPGNFSSFWQEQRTFPNPGQGRWWKRNESHLFQDERPL